MLEGQDAQSNTVQSAYLESSEDKLTGASTTVALWLFLLRSTSLSLSEQVRETALDIETFKKRFNFSGKQEEQGVPDRAHTHRLHTAFRPLQEQHDGMSL